jgi:NAD(P)-dependent dehydrogenase (short-subunit alcohol dehydrogenase family)
MRSFADELGEHGIRVTPSIPPGEHDDGRRPADREVVRGGPSILAEVGATLLPVSVVEPAAVSEAVVWLAPDAPRYDTGVALPIDAGPTARF